MIKIIEAFIEGDIPKSCSRCQFKEYDHERNDILDEEERQKLEQSWPTLMPIYKCILTNEDVTMNLLSRAPGCPLRIHNEKE
jgi:hypothetical protein